MTATRSQTSSADRPRRNSRAAPRPSSPRLPDEAIVVRGAKVHNLRNVSVTLPRDKLVVLTGPSGSGKSSLAFDTIYAEGQRRYVESLSAYARQFLEQVGKPEVEAIDGLSPTISIEQRTTSYNPRSTVGTVTEIYDHLRLLFARIGRPFCYQCGKPIQSQTQQQMVDQIQGLEPGTRVSILAPIVRGRKGEYQKELLSLRQKGFVRVRVDGEIRDLSEDFALDKNKKHTIDVYVDRLILKDDRSTLSARLTDAVEMALRLGEGLLILEIHDGRDGAAREQLMSEKFACIDCGVSYPAPEPRTFSFNSPMGACPTCEGLGTDPSAEEEDDDDDLELDSSNSISKDLVIQAAPCPECRGARLRRESLSIRLAGRNISELGDLPLGELGAFFQDLSLSERERRIADRILKEIRERVAFLLEVGVGYLSLGRSAQSLSGGEAQRIRLATQIGSSLVGVIYVLDEPSIGLHQRDNDKLIETLIKLRDLGNTVLVVEHDRDTIEKADHVVDLGPGAGARGGEVIAEGPLASILANPDSLTGQYLRGEKKIEVPSSRRKWTAERSIRIEGAYANNLKKVDVQFPLGTFTCVTGVSGSGKSTLVIDTLYKALVHQLYGSEVGPLELTKIEGLEQIDKVIDIDQSPIGKTPRSNPATYTGIFSLIRELFAGLPESQIRGYAPGRYSFNVKGGRCEKCEGDGVTRVEMHFLPDVFVECESCHGKRYSRETLEITYKGKNIAEVLDMTAEEALTFFDAIPALKQKLKTLNDVGLGYVKLGQSATTLSGGEAQRMKLCKELSRRSTGRTFYILDEPSTGLHFDDVRNLLQILQELVNQGNTVLVIEHNLDIIKVADHLIDMGPEGGSEGGKLVVAGSPEEVAACRVSHTGKFLAPYLNPVV